MKHLGTLCFIRENLGNTGFWFRNNQVQQIHERLCLRFSVELSISVLRLWPCSQLQVLPQPPHPSPFDIHSFYSSVELLWVCQTSCWKQRLPWVTRLLTWKKINWVWLFHPWVEPMVEPISKRVQKKESHIDFMQVIKSDLKVSLENTKNAKQQYRHTSFYCALLYGAS